MTTDFSGILSLIDGATAVTSVVAAAAILAIVGFAGWAAHKVGGFFDGGDETPTDYAYDEACPKCGEYSGDQNTLCPNCQDIENDR